MEALLPSLSSSLPLTLPPSKNTLFRTKSITSTVNLISHKRCTIFNANRRSVARIAAINDVSAATSPAGVEVTWQIVVGVIAGVTPFVVAGIEFSKRIMAQKRCEVCGGSGLVLRDKYYFRCPGCGGFLPWQSWKRFFSAILTAIKTLEKTQLKHWAYAFVVQFDHMSMAAASSAIIIF
ncbi:uncharacterized protein LOC132176262 [Corylus avellana]|uniref:uncharacterized protein LOC132176262 n=1 Tax=Corylus avellana TaxID=13451 RepID=UPI001E1ED3AA|nr:uncharacterized protein LOC132176262 [Corylus avellana]